MKKLTAALMGVAVLIALTAFATSVGANDDIRSGKSLDTLKENRYVQDEIIVKFKPGVKEEAISDLNKKHGAHVKYTSSHGKFKRIGIPASKTVPEMVEIYNKNPNVEYAEPNYYVHAMWAPNDPYYSYQWHLDNDVYGGIHMEDAWELLGAPGDPGEGVNVSIIDTGIAYEDYPGYEQAPDLAQTCFVPGYDFVNDDTHPNDDNGHGTHVAGTVAQSTNNSIGVAGVAFDACLMPVKVLDRQGGGTVADVADGIYYATDNRADIISMSLGGPASLTLEDAVAYAYNHSVTVVAAAGNDGSDTLSYPAAYNEYVIAVGATRYDEDLADYSNYGPSLDLVAPGGDLNVDQNSDSYGDGVLQQTFGWNPTDWGYYFYQGTSMATPHVSGVAALLIANGNADTPGEVRTALQETAEDLGDEGIDDTYGWGLVDASAALQWTAGPEPPAITGFAPESPVSDVVGSSRTFNITTDQSVNVSWQMNGSEVQRNESVTNASYTNTSAAIGTWNVSAIASNSNGTAMQTWVWTVTGKPPAITSWENNITGNDSTSFTVERLTAVEFNVTANQTIANWTWVNASYIAGNGTTDSNASRLFDNTGLVNVSVYGTNANGTTSTITWSVNVVDTTPPAISNVTATDITDTSAKITWDTNESADSLVKYGTESGNYTYTANDSAYVTSHAVNLTGLAPNTTYYYVVNSTDESGNSNKSSEHNFTTEEAPSNTMHISDVYLWLDRTRGPWEDIGVEVTVVDSDGNGLSDVTVDIQLETPEDNSLTSTATTDTSGVASTIFDKASRTPGNYTATVTGLSLSGYTWNTSADVETSDTLTTG